MKAGYGKTVRPVCAADGGKLFIGRLLRPDTEEANNGRQLPAEVVDHGMFGASI
jgi:hypothetical protein